LRPEVKPGDPSHKAELVVGKPVAEPERVSSEGGDKELSGDSETRELDGASRGNGTNRDGRTQDGTGSSIQLAGTINIYGTTEKERVQGWVLGWGLDLWTVMKVYSL